MTKNGDLAIHIEAVLDERGMDSHEIASRVDSEWFPVLSVLTSMTYEGRIDRFVYNGHTYYRLRKAAPRKRRLAKR